VLREMKSPMAQMNDECCRNGGDPPVRGPGKAGRNRLAAVLILVGLYMIAETVGGILANSLALLADAGHMLSDAAALALSLFALWISGRPATPRRTYGYYRAEILAALANGAALVAVSLFIFAEAFRRLKEPPQVQGMLMTAIAAGGLAGNLLGLRILGPARDASLNLRGAWLHVLADALGSVAAIVGGCLVWLLGWNLADPILSMAIGLLVIHSSWGLLKESVSVLMEFPPGHIDVDKVREAIAKVPGVISIHDLHVWSITTGHVALSCHIVLREERPQTQVLEELRSKLSAEFGIHHVTIQFEPQEWGS
jgi:cobalt-zinc-cadmium efflux system protein